MKNKRCRVCNEIKLLEKFTKDRTKKDGYHNNCKECNKEKMRLWRINNPGYDRKHDETRKAGYCQKYMNEYQKNRRKKSPTLRIMSSLRASLNNYLTQKRCRKDKNTYQIIGCTPDELREWIENQWTEEMSWENYGNKKGCWSIDHIIPLGPASTKEEIYERSHYTNLQPLWWDENIRKRDYLLEK